MCAQLIEAPGWSNGRDVITWLKRIFRAYSLRQHKVGWGPNLGSTALITHSYCPCLWGVNSRHSRTTKMGAYLSLFMVKVAAGVNQRCRLLLPCQSQQCSQLNTQNAKHGFVRRVCIW